MQTSYGFFYSFFEVFTTVFELLKETQENMREANQDWKIIKFCHLVAIKCIESIENGQNQPYSIFSVYFIAVYYLHRFEKSV